MTKKLMKKINEKNRRNQIWLTTKLKLATEKAKLDADTNLSSSSITRSNSYSGSSSPEIIKRNSPPIKYKKKNIHDGSIISIEQEQRGIDTGNVKLVADTAPTILTRRAYNDASPSNDDDNSSHDDDNSSYDDDNSAYDDDNSSYDEDY